jgi:membrane-bound ClpP family serine protease
VTDDRPREFLQLSDGRYVRVASTGDGELTPVEEPVKPQRARSGSASAAVAFSSHVAADAPGCGLCTWSPREGRWALKFVNQACALHRDDQVEHD